MAAWAIRPSVTRAPGNPGHERPAVLDADVLRRALQELGGNLLRPRADLARGAGDRRAGVRRDAAPARAHADGEELRVARHDVDVVQAHAELRRADLGEGGLVALALRGHPDGHEDLAARVDAHLRALVGPDAGALDVAGDAEPDPPGRPVLRGPAGAELRVAEELERALEAGGEVPGVVGDRDPVLVGDARPVGHLARLHQVAPADLDGVEPEPPRPDVEEPLHDEHGLGAPRAAVGGVVRLVRHVARADAPVVGHPVGPRHVVHGVEGEPRPFDGIRAHVGQEHVVDGHDRPVPPERDPRPVDLLAVVARGGEVLAPPLDPLHGPPEAEGDGRHEELLVIDGALRAEAAPHVGGEHPHLLGRDPEDHGHGVAHEVGVLGGRPDDQQAGLGVPVSEDAARLDRHGRDPRMAELFLHDQVGGRESPLDVAGAPARDDGGVVGPVGVNPLGAAGGGLGRRHRRERVVVDHDPVEGVAEPIGVVRDDDRHRLADVPHHFRREDALDVGACAGRPAEGRGDAARDLGEVGGGEDRHAGQRSRLVRGDPADPGVGVGASHHAEVDGAGPPQVVQVPPAPLEQRGVLLPAGRGADRAAVRHAAGPGR